MKKRSIKRFSGFTLTELLVVVLIIGILAAVSLPMYNKAVLKSRFATLMPTGKAIAESNEVYYLEHGRYATEPQDLVIQKQAEDEDGTQVELVNDGDYIYTLAYNPDKLPSNNYIVFQKRSARFRDTTMCEAQDEKAGEVCMALGGTPLNGGVTSGWTAYLLSGTPGAGDAFMTPVEKIVEEKCPTGDCIWFSDESTGTVTICGEYAILRNGDCYANTTCDGTCPPGSICGCGGYSPYKRVYDQNGQIVSLSGCTYSSTNSCKETDVVSFTYNEDGSSNRHTLTCNGRVPNCTGAKGGYDQVWSASNQRLSHYTCTAYCTGYSAMQEWNYDNGTRTRTCTQIDGKTCKAWSDWSN